MIQVEDRTVKLPDQVTWHSSAPNENLVTVNVTCIPDAYIKGWELKVVYDQSILRLVSITEGGFFHGYQTFYVANGSITYGLIVGQHGNTSEKGVLCILTFQPLKEGVAVVDLADAGVCNESRYLPLQTRAGTITILGQVIEKPPMTWADITSLRIAMQVLFHEL